MATDAKKTAEKTERMEGAVSETMSSAGAQEQKIAELTESLQRLQAEFANYQKRADRDMDAFHKFASHDIIMDILPVLDSFELALQHTKDKDAKKGMELIFSQLKDALAKRGVERIAKEDIFDATLHEALLTEESGKPEGTILEILQPGYTMHGRVIRAAKVKIAKKSAEKSV